MVIFKKASAVVSVVKIDELLKMLISCLSCLLVAAEELLSPVRELTGES